MIQARIQDPFLRTHPQPQTAALQGSAFNVLSSYTMITTPIQKDLHDRRLIELNKEMVES
ncbi:hypothetical protein DPMN_073564 [Dreissena polymorpha]|uniref:Uncharacterized protein n=1 Tax=Dreissena polymorpha TaxID=45954 RepID=A0A9D4BZ89_DREPO|nr:hypothetical protein DPMN_073564 [Dreissena polymorpha]